MWILNVEFSASTWNFLSLVILSAIFNVRVLGFSMYFCLKNNKDLLFIYLFIYLFIDISILHLRATVVKLFTKSTNNRGPRIDPWGTPTQIESASEKAPWNSKT